MGLLQKFKAYLNEDDAEYDALVEEEERLREERKQRRSLTKAQKKEEKSKRAIQKAVRQQRVTPELRKEVRETVSSNSERKTVGDFCEQLVDVSYHMDDMKREYKIVTDYLVDIQRIEELPMQMAQEIIQTAKDIEQLDSSRSTYQQSENLLSMEQYVTMERLEEQVPETIKNLLDMEVRDSMLKNDMGYLEGEKEDLKYARVEDTDQAYRIRGVVITVLIAFLLTIMSLLLVSVIAKINVVLPSCIIATVAVGIFVACFLRYNTLTANVRETDAKLKRAVSLLNKVKVKYINNTNTMDYIYEKYGVNSAKELEYIWEQYNRMKRDARKYNKASEDYRMYCDKLISQLADAGLSDPLVWPKQTSALIDRREMVEIKHGLNVRRQTIREKVASSEKLCEAAKAALHQAIANNPGIEGYIKELLAGYNLSL